MRASKEIIEVLEYLCKKIGVVIDWTSDNVLPYVNRLCEQFVKWEIGTSIAWILIMLVLTIIGFTLFKFVDMDGVENLIFICIVVTAIIVIATQIFNIITCYTFPEKAIYDYLKFNGYL